MSFWPSRLAWRKSRASLISWCLFCCGCGNSMEFHSTGLLSRGDPWSKTKSHAHVDLFSDFPQPKSLKTIQLYVRIIQWDGWYWLMRSDKQLRTITQWSHTLNIFKAFSRFASNGNSFSQLNHLLEISVDSKFHPKQSLLLLMIGKKYIQWIFWSYILYSLYIYIYGSIYSDNRFTLPSRQEANRDSHRSGDGSVYMWVEA